MKSNPQTLLAGKNLPGGITLSGLIRVNPTKEINKGEEEEGHDFKKCDFAKQSQFGNGGIA